MHKQRGVTITDAILSLLILSVGILGTIKYSTISKKANIASMQRAEAIVLAQDKIESYRRYSTLATTVGATAYADIATGSDTVTGESAVFTRTWTVTDNTSSNYKTVSISVTWTTADNSSESVNLVTSISEIDPDNSGELFATSSTTLSPSSSN